MHYIDSDGIPKWEPDPELSDAEAMLKVSHEACRTLERKLAVAVEALKEVASRRDYYYEKDGPVEKALAKIDAIGKGEG